MPFVRGVWMRRVSTGAVALAFAGLAGCSHVPLVGKKPAPPPPPATAGTGIGVNGYLWRATLDTLAFMPLASADPYGGTVITVPPYGSAEASGMKASVSRVARHR